MGSKATFLSSWIFNQSVSNLYTIRPQMVPTCYCVYDGLNVRNLEYFCAQVDRNEQDMEGLGKLG